MRRKLMANVDMRFRMVADLGPASLLKLIIPSLHTPVQTMNGCRQDSHVTIPAACAAMAACSSMSELAIKGK